jgi:hypothetical protein
MYTGAPKSIDYQAGELKLSGLNLSESAKADALRALQARAYQLQTQGDVLVLRRSSAP